MRWREQNLITSTNEAPLLIPLLVLFSLLAVHGPETIFSSDSGQSSVWLRCEGGWEERRRATTRGRLGIRTRYSIVAHPSTSQLRRHTVIDETWSPQRNAEQTRLPIHLYEQHLRAENVVWYKPWHHQGVYLRKCSTSHPMTNSWYFSAFYVRCRVRVYLSPRTYKTH